MLRNSWRLARPYWFSEDRWAGRGLLVIVVALTLFSVFLEVQFNQWNNDFYNALQDKNVHVFWYQIGKFCILAAVFIVAAVYRLYFNQMLQIRWRRWMTEHYVGDWLGQQVYYRMSLTDSGTDNPDQRITEDIQSFISQSLALTLGLLNSVVTLVSFIAILWGLSGALTVLGVTIPGYMVWVALIYAIVGTALTHLVGKRLIPLNFNQQRFEADFRFSLVRFRENTEGVALYRGEAEEKAVFRDRFSHIFTNWWALMLAQKRLTWLTVGYAQVANIFPLVVAAPRYFAGTIQLGGLIQISSAFGQVQGALSYFVDAYTTLASWAATVDRLVGFQQAIATAQNGITAEHGLAVTSAPQSGMTVQIGQLALPDGRILIQDSAVNIAAGAHVLVTGPSGTGKSTLFRAIAGLWPFGQGRITIPAGARMLFLPQKPYLPLGSLRHVVCYPDAPEDNDAAVIEALRACNLPHLVDRLDQVHNWAQELSPGEQQRIAIARVLLNRPDWLFLDEATSAQDEAGEQSLYSLLRDRLPDATVVSIGHRPTLAAFHDTRLVIRSGADQGAPVLAQL